MLEIDLRSVWLFGHRTFTLWVIPAWLLTNLLFLRARTKFGWAKVALADAAMTLAATIVTVIFPVWLVAWFLVHKAIDGRISSSIPAPRIWMLAPLTALVVSWLASVSALRCLGVRVKLPDAVLLGLLNLGCLGVAAYWMWVTVAAIEVQA